MRSSLSCPQCQKVVYEDETVCPHCGAWLDGPGGTTRVRVDSLGGPDDPDATLVDNSGDIARVGQDLRQRRPSRSGGSAASGAGRRMIDSRRMLEARASRLARRPKDSAFPLMAMIVAGLLAGMVLLFYGINRFSGGGSDGGWGKLPASEDSDTPTDPVKSKYHIYSGSLTTDGEVKLLARSPGKLSEADCNAVVADIAKYLNRQHNAHQICRDLRRASAWQKWKSGGGKVWLRIKSGIGQSTLYFDRRFRVSDQK